MSNLVTKIADILTPDVWNSYGAQRTMELSALYQSGIITQIPGVDIPNGGATINLPFFHDISGDLEVLDDGDSLTTGKITTAKQVAIVIGRGRAWAVNDLAAVFAGADPARAIMDRIAAYWAREMQKELLATLKGVFAVEYAAGPPEVLGMEGLIHDIHDETAEDAVISAETFVDATQKLGDAKGQLTAIAMHSAVEAKLAKDRLIVYETDVGKSDRVPTFMGKRVIVDDGMPVADGVYTTYLFGSGVIGYAERPIGASELETDRDILAGEDVMAMRRRFILHPVGMKWRAASISKAFPGRAEMDKGASWARVFETKAIPMVAFKHRVVAVAGG